MNILNAESQNSDFRLMTTKVAADRIGVKEAYIKRMCRDRKLNGIKVGKFWRITEAALAEFIASLVKSNTGNGGFSQDAKDRIRFHANLRSRDTAPDSIEKLSQDIDHLKVALQTEDQLKKVALTARLRDHVIDREVKRMRLDEIPEVLNTLADSAYPGMRELVNEDPEALETLFAAEVNGGDQDEAGGTVEMDLPAVPASLDD